jgi:chitinase
MTSWSQKRPGAGKFTPENVDALLCTHVIYAFATLKDHKLAAADEKDIEMYESVVGLREKNPSLKVLTGAYTWRLDYIQ